MEPAPILGMMCLAKNVKALLEGTIEKFFQVKEEVALITVINNSNYEYNCPQAMKIFSRYKKDGKAFDLSGPEEIAQKISSAILAGNDIIENIEVMKGGMMNIKLKNSLIEEEITKLVIRGCSYPANTPKKIVVDFSSPNIAKEMHVGHLRSTIIGESLCRILEFQKHDVKRVNHLGDWGTQFGMLIQHMREIYPDFLMNTPQLKDLETFYKAAKKRFDDDMEFKKKSQLNVVALQSGDPECRKAWEMICYLSRLEFNKIYKRLDVTLEEFGESYYNDMIPGVMKELEEKKIMVEDQGAKCVFVAGQPNPLIIQKSDGGFGYDSTDAAAVWYRLEKLKADWVIYITDAGQEPHFKMIFDLAKRAGWHNPPKTRLDHMGFGVIQGEDGKKFKTRSGEVVKLMDLLDEAKERAAEDLTKRSEVQVESNRTALNPAEIQDGAEKIGMSAVKYFDLRQNRISTYQFS